jgi:tRNA (guanosine-2'-O-)-methyltransferase
MRRESDTVFEPGRLSAGVPWHDPWTSHGVIDVLGPMVSDARRARLEQVLARRLASVTVLLDSPHDPHNGAAILRSCDAFGVQELHVIPKSESFVASNLVAKGAERWVDVIEHRDGVVAAAHLIARGYLLVATHPQGKLVPEDLARLERVCLVLGNERDGISADLAARAAESVCIPMVGFVESLNVSVSTAILLRAATQGRPGDLDHASRQRLLARGLFYSVPRAGEILAALGSPKPEPAPDR